jgi:glutathione-regulated potassium-efflux system ancillary protein KefF
MMPAPAPAAPALPPAARLGLDRTRPGGSGAPVLVIAAHPDLRTSRVNRHLLDAAHQAAGAGPQAVPAGIEIRELYRLYPDFAIDVAAEQAALDRAELIVWQHPIHWYAMPSLMKHWVDEVLTHGWAYGQGGTALAGKCLWLVASTGAPETAYHPQGYNRYFFDAFLPPYEQTAALCGLSFLPPWLIHGAHRLDGAALTELGRTYAERLAGWPDPAVWTELAELADCPACVVPGGDRPVAEAAAVAWAQATPMPAHAERSVATLGA